MTSLNSFNNNNSDIETLTLDHYTQEVRPFMSWKWCFTIVGIIPAIIVNSLFKKKSPTLTRPHHQSVKSVFSTTTTHRDLHTGDFVANVPIPTPLNTLPMPLIPVPNVDIITPITSKRPENYIKQSYIINDHQYIVDTLHVYEHYQNSFQIPTQNPVDTTTFNSMRNTYMGTTKHKSRLHLPTIELCCRELTPMLEDSRRHFIAKTNRRLSRQEINYYFGRHMLPKVLSHLSTNTKFLVSSHSLIYTACEVIYLFLKKSNRVLPHAHLTAEIRLDDVELFYNKTHIKSYWTDWNGKVWEVEKRFKKKATPLGRCLFQFPTAELNSTVTAC